MRHFYLLIACAAGCGGKQADTSPAGVAVKFVDASAGSTLDGGAQAVERTEPGAKCQPFTCPSGTYCQSNGNDAHMCMTLPESCKSNPSCECLYRVTGGPLSSCPTGGICEDHPLRVICQYE